MGPHPQPCRTALFCVTTKETEAERNVIRGPTAGAHPGLCGSEFLLPPHPPYPPQCGHTFSLSQRSSRLIYGSPYFIHKESETPRGCHLPLVTASECGVGTGEPPGMRFSSREAGLERSACTRAFDGCLPVGHATFTHGPKAPQGPGPPSPSPRLYTGSPWDRQGGTLTASPAGQCRLAAWTWARPWALWAPEHPGRNPSVIAKLDVECL